MKIGIVAPSPVPFTVGGAENLFWGLQDYINSQTLHQCELVKIASKEDDFWQLIDSYERFLSLEVAHFDVVISTKYPSWMISHRRHVCYMLHKLRGLYDTYHFCRLPEHFHWEGAGLCDLRNHIEAIRRNSSADKGQILDLFAKLRELRDSGVNPEAFAFPAPLIREIVHLLDGHGLALERITRYAAISANVRGRADYFPPAAEVSILYPPPRLQGHRCGSDDFLFTVSRLDGPKRIGLLIEAMKYVKSDVPLLIAGTGPDEERLRSLAGDDDRIRLLGFVRDGEVLDYYADALAVPFLPYDEDYGLVTIEAMRSGKPVLTVTDAGGPNEFVRNGETGFSVSPDPHALAERIDYLCAHREVARRMGKNGQQLVRGISWRAVCDGLVTDAVSARPALSRITRKSNRRKIVVATTFPVFPPRGGGQARIFNLYRNLARRFDVDIVSLCGYGEAAMDDWIAPGLREIRIPKSEAHHLSEIEHSRSVEWIPVTDIVMPLLFKKTPQYVGALTSAAANAHAVVASHPYALGAIRECAGDKPLWFEAHNVEYELKQGMLPDTTSGRYLLQTVKEAEGQAWKSARAVFACTHADLKSLATLYGATSVPKIEVPNGVCVGQCSVPSAADRRALRERIGLSSNKVAFFLGSWHGPNLNAVERVLHVAAKLPDITFLVVGSAGLAFRERFVPSNVVITGPVEEQEKEVLQHAADIALNPMSDGSGSNLKMLDYAVAGLPVLSTPFGARGFDFVPGSHYFAAELERFPVELTAALALGSARARVATAARDLVISRYSWGAIAKAFITSIAEFGSEIMMA